MSLEGKAPEEVQAMAALADSLLNDPKTRRQFQRMLKQQNPNISLPELDTEDAIVTAVKPHVEELQRLKAEREQDKAQQAANLLFENLRDDRVVSTRTEFSELVKWASENGYQTVDAGLRKAASARRAEQEAAEPTPQSAAGGGIVPKDNKDLMRDPQGWARSQAVTALNDIIKSRGRAA